MIDPFICTPDDVENSLGKLTVTYSTPIKKEQLDDAERALLFTYTNRFGEAPPLNLSLPQRWEDSPTDREITNWAERGVLGRK